MPPPYIQPVDYRRLLHHQVYAPTATYQNPTHMRRFHQSQNIIKETVDSEAQTDSPQKSPVLRSDSGHGTASASPSSSLSPQKQHSAEVVNFEACSKVIDFQVNNTNTCSTLKHGFPIQHRIGTQTVQESIRATLEEQLNHKKSVQKNVPTCQYGHCDLSVSSSDSIVPVCSSSQQDEVVKERRTSISDTTSRGSDTPQVTMLKMGDEMQPQNDELFSVSQTRHEKSLSESVWSVEDLPPFFPRVDTGIQCSLQEKKCLCEEMRSMEDKNHPFSSGNLQLGQ